MPMRSSFEVTSVLVFDTEKRREGEADSIYFLFYFFSFILSLC
jgi:hypothetical protein